MFDGDSAAAIVAAAAEEKPSHHGHIVVPADGPVALRAALSGQYEAFAGAETIPNDREETCDATA
jgi:hypothetical protein